ncbi:WD domain protein [Beauveria brongniartii RCEF 3172]|uniref:WD domain protein n=1 Tax=Beauveria brongniartii RCEF 3172 TaxID=1081107 RepID=A0A167EKV3_9HYPO|nr:WD domain protein [Beauveria brongniartii RCEF 3172]
MNDCEVRLGSYRLYSIVWIAAIEIELTAATAMLDEEHEPPTDFRKNESDVNKYIWGRVGKHNILIAFLPAGHSGQNNAATTIACFKSSLPHIKFGVLVGIAGAIPRTTVLAGKVCIDKKRDIRLGDVVIGHPGGTTPGVVQYDMGKMQQETGWERIGSVNLPPADLLSVVQFLGSRRNKLSNQMQTFIKKMIERDSSLEEVSEHQGEAHDRLFNADYVHRTGNPDCSSCDPSQEIPRPIRKSTLPEIHYGVILSGNSVVKDAKQRDMIAMTTKQDCICFEMEAAAIVSQLPCLVIRGICDYADSHKNDVWQKYAAATAAAYAKILICNLDPRVQVNTIPCKELAYQLAPVSESVKKIEQSWETVATAAELDVLSRLPISDEARYDSWEEGESPLCLPETRKDVFKQLFEWLEKDRPRTLWLNGMAGTGKSTISRSFATDLKKRGQLGASFFFKRDDLKRGRAQMFSSTIAADLASHLPAVRASIVDTVKRNDRIAHTDAKKQFQLLVLDPLSKAQLDKNIAIVIDAVDECHDTDLKSLFALVSAFQRAELPRVKLFLTSRPDLPVLKGYKPSTEKYVTIALHEVQRSTIDHDIRIYLKHRLQEIRESYNWSVGKFGKPLAASWPSRKDVEKLLKMSNQLFIFAATMCRSLEEDSMSSPDLQLSGLLELKATTGDAFESIYKPVLNRQIPQTFMTKDYREDLIRECKQVLGAICVLRSPVSVPALARLLGLDVENVEHRLRSLQSVIEVISPKDSTSKEETQIRILHRSFRDYFLSEEVSEFSPIRVTEKDAHHAMVRGCLATLNKPKTGLRFDICQLKMPGTPRSSVRPEVLARFFTQDLAYACRHLTGHALSARFEITDGDEIHQFLLSHLLHWLEASAYLGNHGNPAREFLRLISLVNRDKKSKKVLALLRDAYRFAAAHYDSLDQAPLQIYTALIFTPTNSIVRRTFGHKYNAWVQRKPVVDNNWSMAFRTTTVKPLPAQGILKLLFSPNEKILAAMSWDAVWFMTFLGEQLFWIPIDNPLGNGESPVAVVFSSDSKLIALRNGIDEIGIWNMEGGSEYFKKKVALFKVEYDADYFHRPRSFTHNNNCVLIASYHFADIWSIESGLLVGKILFPDAAHEVAVSPDCSLLAGHFDDGLIYWNIVTGQQVRRASLPTKKKALSYDLVLSSNETAWTITTESIGGMEVYSTTSDGMVAHLVEEKNAYAISAYYLIIEYEDDIRIWKHGNKNPQVIKKPSRRPATTIAYSAKHLASSTTDDIAPGVIFFTELPKHQPRITKSSPYLADSECGDEYLEKFINSPNGTMLASIGPEGARIVSAIPGLPSFVKQRGLMEMIAFSSTGDYFTTSQGSVLYLWERTGNGHAVLRNQYVPDEEYYIETVSFWSDACLITEVHYTKCTARLVVLGVPSFKALWIKRIPGLGVHEAVLSPDGRLLAIIYEEALDIRDILLDTSILWLGKKKVFAVQISPDSTLALLIDKRNLELWHIGRNICLYSETRYPFSGVTFDGKQRVIHTNTGKIAYHIASGTVQAPCRESGPERASLPDNSGWQGGHSPAAIQAGPLTMTLMRIGWGTAKDGSWITWNGQNWIRLPTQYCARDSAVDGNCLLIVNKTLVEARYEFDEVPVLEEQSNNVDVEMTDYQESVPKGLGIRQY